MTAPSTAGKPPPPWLPRIAPMVATPANETPCTKGSWQPKNGRPRVCSSVASPPANNEAAISRPISAGGQASRLAEDQRYRDDPAIHGQNVLQAVGQVGAKPEVFILWALGGRRARGRSHGAGSQHLLLWHYCRQHVDSIAIKIVYNILILTRTAVPPGCAFSGCRMRSNSLNAEVDGCVQGRMGPAQSCLGRQETLSVRFVSRLRDFIIRSIHAARASFRCCRPRSIPPNGADGSSNRRRYRGR